MQIWKGIVLAVVLAVVLAGGPVAVSAQEGPRARAGDLKVGDAAPDFTVSDLNDKTTVKLSALRGKPVVLVFGSCT
jgi:cytochrome oxidase Cu insertion factor (SCO1/SenC/PrrC family)